jgi:hypothetical protein
MARKSKLSMVLTTGNPINRSWKIWSLHLNSTVQTVRLLPQGANSWPLHQSVELHLSTGNTRGLADGCGEALAAEPVVPIRSE